MPKRITVRQEYCCGCMLCSLECSVRNQECFWPAQSFISVQGDRHEASFSIIIDSQCNQCLACTTVCPTGALQWRENDVGDTQD